MKTTNKIFSILTGIAMTGMFMVSGTAQAADQSAASPAVQSNAQGSTQSTAADTAKVTASDPAKAGAAEDSMGVKPSGRYLFESPRWGYSIVCPSKPIGVMPVSMIYGNGRKGDVLIFEYASDGSIKKAWAIFRNAFEEKALPDLNKLSQKDQSDLVNAYMNGGYGYQQVAIVETTKNNKALMCITAKNVAADTTGDGKPDKEITADSQIAVMFFRGNKGGRFSTELVMYPELTQEDLNLFRTGSSTVWES